MKLPSITHVWETTKATLLRFPFALGVAIIGTAAAIWLIDVPYHQHDSRLAHELVKVMMTCALGLPLFIAAMLFAERQNLDFPWRIGLKVVGVALLLAYYLTLPIELEGSPSYHAFRFVVLSAGLHFLVAFAPFLRPGEVNGFWQYNKTLFLRFLTAALYSTVLFIGLSLALVALEQLFDVNIDEETYAQLWVFIVGIFNTWFFLAGVPRKLADLDAIQDYPRGLKAFTQYVLIPLICIYFVILYAYAGKIILQWDWPRGWVSYLISGFSVLGIFSLLLIFPIQNQEENRWIKTYSRLFYIILSPLIVMLFLAIWERVSDYGITENRYYLLVLTFWLAGITLYFIFSRAKNIKVIPISLCLIAFLVAFGPWGSFAVSKRSQVNRLADILQRNELLVNGTIQKSEETIPLDDQKEVSAIVRYLHERHGLHVIQPWFGTSFADMMPDSLQDKQYNYRLPEIVVTEGLGLPYLDRWQTALSDWASYNTAYQQACDVSGFDVLMEFSAYHSSGKSQFYEKYAAKIDTTANTVQFFQADSLLIAVELNPQIDRLQAISKQSKYDIPADSMRVDQTEGDLRVRLYLQNLQINNITQQPRLDNVSGKILIDWPNTEQAPTGSSD